MARTPPIMYIPAGQPDPVPCGCQPRRIAAPSDAAVNPLPDFLDPLSDLRYFGNQVGQGVQFASRLSPAAWLGIGLVAVLLLNRR